MFDIASTELLVVAVIALVAVGPKELPALVRGLSSGLRTMRNMAAEFRAGFETLAREVEESVDQDGKLREDLEALRRAEGITPGMSPEEITNHIMAKRQAEQDAAADQAEALSESEQSLVESAANEPEKKAEKAQEGVKDDTP